MNELLPRALGGVEVGPEGQAVTRKYDYSIRVGSTGDTTARYSEGDRARVIAMTRAGESSTAIALAIGCSSRHVQRVRRAAREEGLL